MQVIRPALLKAGFELVAREVLEVTDDVSIIEALGLNNPIYKPTAAYGHFGRHPEVTGNGRALQLFPWELTNRVDELRSAAG